MTTDGYTLVTCGSRCPPVIPTLSRCPKMMPDDVRRSQMISDDFRWPQMISDGLWITSCLLVSC